MVFFFQAEDGIRDHCVTGVQTCALPIYAIIDQRLKFGWVRFWSRKSIGVFDHRSEEHTSELQSHSDLVCRLLLEKKKDATTRSQMHDRRGPSRACHCPS